MAGDKVFVDYSGKKPHIFDSKTGEFTELALARDFTGIPL